jgi:hypothetical protein
MVSGTNWVYTGVFASGVYGDMPLTYPQGLAQDADHRIYVGEMSLTGRVLRFEIGQYGGQEVFAGDVKFGPAVIPELKEPT